MAMPFGPVQPVFDSRFQRCILHTRVRKFACRVGAMFPVVVQESGPGHGTTPANAKPGHRFPVPPEHRRAVAPALQFPRQNCASAPDGPCDLAATSRTVPPAGHKESS